jgi:hypothetical protein
MIVMMDVQFLRGSSVKFVVEANVPFPKWRSRNFFVLF